MGCEKLNHHVRSLRGEEVMFDEGFGGGDIGEMVEGLERSRVETVGCSNYKPMDITLQANILHNSHSTSCLGGTIKLNEGVKVDKNIVIRD